MTVVVAAVIFGLLLVGIGVLLGRRTKARSEAVFGTPAPPASSSAPGPTAGPTDGPDLTGLTEGLQAAMADGHMSDEEIQHLLPRAEVWRQGDGVTVAWTSSSTTQRIEGPDGQVYDSIDDIPDPALRERLRRLLGDS